jgi:hypothetical protein
MIKQIPRRLTGNDFIRYLLEVAKKPNRKTECLRDLYALRTFAFELPRTHSAISQPFPGPLFEPPISPIMNLG